MGSTCYTPYLITRILFRMYKLGTFKPSQISILSSHQECAHEKNIFTQHTVQQKIRYHTSNKCTMQSTGMNQTPRLQTPISYSHASNHTTQPHSASPQTVLCWYNQYRTIHNITSHKHLITSVPRPIFQNRSNCNNLMQRPELLS